VIGVTGSGGSNAFVVLAIHYFSLEPMLNASFRILSTKSAKGN
jgi:hypothetical protein